MHHWLGWWERITPSSPSNNCINNGSPSLSFLVGITNLYTCVYDISFHATRVLALSLHGCFLLFKTLNCLTSIVNCSHLPLWPILVSNGNQYKFQFHFFLSLEILSTLVQASCTPQPAHRLPINKSRIQRSYHGRLGNGPTTRFLCSQFYLGFKLAISLDWNLIVHNYQIYHRCQMPTRYWFTIAIYEVLSHPPRYHSCCGMPCPNGMFKKGWAWAQVPQFWWNRYPSNLTLPPKEVHVMQCSSRPWGKFFQATFKKEFVVDRT